MRSVRYGCRRTRSHSPAPSGPRLSQIAFDTPSRPKSWTSPARRSVRASSLGQPELRRRRGGELGDRARVAERVRRLEVDEVRDRASSAASNRSPESTTASAGSASITASHVADAVEAGEDHVGVSATAAPRAPGRTACRARRAPAPSPPPTPPTRCATSTNSASCASRAASGIASPAQLARPALARPTARTAAPSASSTSRGQPELLGRARAPSRAWWLIMSSTSRWPGDGELEPDPEAMQRRVAGAEQPQRRERAAAGCAARGRTCPT